ncbi:hypothetical protein BSL78_03852 [Apostichopus japonicus]|uniref:CUB domain-containing protein n=1 Tax=Stichopus japonicus TaxID=307972 RepID=A0A2G8LG35_STIJA|nr:hypothetical protein BSL78_03852 [Apostichopus japonicus]
MTGIFIRFDKSKTEDTHFVVDVYNVTARHNVTSHNYDTGSYPCNLHQEEVYIAPDGLHLLLTIEHFSTDYGDYLRVGNGNVTNERNILLYDQGQFNNETRVLSEENVMWLTFTSDIYDSFGGFSGFVEPVNMTLDELDCGYDFDCQNGACISQRSVCDYQQNCANGFDSAGVTLSDVYNVTARHSVTSHNYDTGSYSCNLHQEEVYIAPDGLHLLLTIEYLNTYYGDYLRVGNGNVTNERNILLYDQGQFNNETRVLSEENVMWLTFTSDIYDSYGGFSGFVEPVNMTLDDVYNVTARHNVTSHNYDTGSYSCNLHQEEVYIAPDGLHLLLTIEYFNTDYGDYLRVGNGNVTNERYVLLYDQGSFDNEIRILSEENVMWLTFTSDNYYNYGGFSGFVEPVNMTLDELDCGYDFDCQNGACISQRSVCDYVQNCANGFDNAGVTLSDVYNVTARHNVTSHNDDTGSYPCNLHQEEVYIAPAGLHLLLTIEYFNTYNGDYLRVGNGNVTNERNILLYDRGPFYNEIRVLSEENVMWLAFTSDIYNSYGGFSGFVEPVNMTLDELDCENDFSCKNGACISQRSVCDSLDNCANGFDTTGSILSDVYNVTARHNVTSHNDDTRTYPCNLHQEEVYIAPDGLHLLLTIEYFNTGYGYYLRVGNGNVKNERNILLYNQGTLNNEIRVLSEENVMWLTFTLDNFNSYGGFSGFVEPVNMTLDGYAEQNTGNA